MLFYCFYFDFHSHNMIAMYDWVLSHVGKIFLYCMQAFL